jgi:hypothetical protein
MEPAASWVINGASSKLGDQWSQHNGASSKLGDQWSQQQAG